jgi:hypothetical protein
VPDAIQNGAAAGRVQPAASDDFVINNKQLAGGGFVQLDPEKKHSKMALYTWPLVLFPSRLNKVILLSQLVFFL